MPRFFTDPPAGDFISVRDGDAAHIGYSLRMKIGDPITLCSSGNDYDCLIEKISESEVVCRVINAAPSRSEPSVKLTLYQAYPKQDKLETIIQKTTELGASRIVPFISARCIARPDKESYRKKLGRFRRIAEEAAKQSGRGIIPEIGPLMSMREAADDMRACSVKLICCENGGERLSDIPLPKLGSAAVMIGSEGGFERSETELAAAAGAVPVWLGERILRCETCPIAVTAIIMNLTGNI